MPNPQPFIKPDVGIPAKPGNSDRIGGDWEKADKTPVIKPDESKDGNDPPAPLINPSGGGAVTR